jgi:hypothetical protein
MDLLSNPLARFHLFSLWGHLRKTFGILDWQQTTSIHILSYLAYAGTLVGVNKLIPPKQIVPSCLILRIIHLTVPTPGDRKHL